MTLDTSGFTDKDSKRPEYRALYEAMPFVEAYSRHTDMRIERDGPALAIGGQWEEHGPMQLAFLRDRGLTPQSRLLDLGCGTGRFARHAVPYLAFGAYVGLDISEGALAHCRKLATREGWGVWGPTFLHGDGTLAAVAGSDFDLIWAHSVFTHLPSLMVRGILGEVAGMRFGEFCFTYRRHAETRRTGLKQFRYTDADLIAMAADAGLKAEPLAKAWPQGQTTMVVRR